jgi:phosphatidylglycerol:prolipoprotein diacylglycerol transferase
VTTVPIDAPTGRARRGERLRSLLPEWPLALPLLAFVGLTIWWLVADSRVVDYDTGRHLLYTFAMRDALAGGDLLAPVTFDNFNPYPPLLYLVGSVAMAIAGESIDAAIIGQDLVFVPLLVVGCYGAARIAYGRFAGAVAAAFALGAPMVVSMFHTYMLDAPQAAMVAVTVWLVLASRRFEAPGIAALAGLAAAGGMLLKPTTAIFLGGFVLAVVALLLVMRLRRLPPWPTSDALAPALALGYAIGRLGCFLVGDDYGRPTDLPVGVIFPEGVPLPTAANLRAMGAEVPSGVAPDALLPVHPTQLYETALALLIWGIGVWLLRRRVAPGTTVLAVIALLAIERFGIEFLRAKDDRFFGEFTLAQVISVAVLLAVGVLAWRRRGAVRAAAATARPAPASPRASTSR